MAEKEAEEETEKKQELISETSEEDLEREETKQLSPEGKRKVIAIVVMILAVAIILSSIGVFLLSEDRATDTDGDGIPDSTDTDDDNDGVLDVDDAFPLDSTEWIDTDGDGVGNNADTDDDNDGVLDVDDAFPLDALESLDIDNDGIGNNVDTDDDGDGISDDLELNTYGSDPLDPDDVTSISGVLLYDSTGENYKDAKPSDIAYLAATNADTSPSDIEIIGVIEITLTETSPAVISGDFVIVTSTTGTNYIHNKSSYVNEVTSSDLSTAIDDFNFQYVELDFTSLSLIYGDHTIGMGVDGQDDYTYVSFDEILTFYNEVHATGVVLPTNFFDEVEVFIIDMTLDLENFQNDFDMDIQGNQQSFLMINTVEYKTQEIIEGDVYEVITPEEVANFGSDLLGENITSTGSNYLIDISKNIGEQIVTFGESENKINNTVMWFILTPLGLNENKLSGIVQLEISEGNVPILEQRIGISFDSSVTYPIIFKIGISPDIDPVSNSSYESREVKELWDKLAEPHQKTTVVSVSVDSFAYVVTLEDAMQKLGVDPLAIEIITTYKNPAFAFLIDQNFTDFLGNDDELLDYTGLALISDFPSRESLIYFLNIRGVLYDTGMFLNSSDLQYPLLVADMYSNNTPNLVEVTLSDLYLDPEAYIGDELLTTIKAEGVAIGTTISTVNPQDYPIDVGVYDLSDRFDNTYYHVPVINISLERGETYLGEHVSVIGFYVNLSKAAEILANSSELAEANIFSGMFSDIIQNFTADNNNIKMLKGFIFAYEMVREAILSNYSVIINAQNVSYSGVGDINLSSSLYAEIEKSSGDWFSVDIVTVKFVVKSPTNQIYYAYSIPSIYTDIRTHPVYPNLPNPLTIPPPIWQTYTVDVYLIDIEAVGNVLAYNSTTFTVNTIPSIDSVTISPTPAYTDSTLTANPIGWNDPDGDPEGYEYQWYKKEGILPWTSISGATLSTLDSSNFIKGNSIYVKVRPYDGKHYGDWVTSGTIIIENGKPSILSASITPSMAYETTTLNADPDGWFDADGDLEGYLYQWYNQNGAIAGAISSTLTGANFDKSDDVYCIITPDDGEDTGNPLTTNTVTILNTPPTITDTSISPNPAFEDDTLTTAGIGWYDADGDVEDYTYQWYSQSGAISGATTSTLSNMSFNVDDQIYCVVTPFDGIDYGPNKTTQTVTIKAVGTPYPVKLNRPIEPNLTSLNLTWNESYEPDFLQYEVYKSITSGFIPSAINLVTTISTRTITYYVVNGLSENTEYYFLVRVNDTTSLFSDSNEVLGATEYNGDSGDDFSNAQNVSDPPRKAWSEHIDGALLGNSVDYFKVYLNAGQTLTVNMTVPTGCDFDLYLYNTTQEEVDSSVTTNPYEEVSTIATTDGYYYIQIYAWLLGGAGIYSLYFIIT